MTLLCVSIMVEGVQGVEEALRDAARAKQEGAELIEFRLDLLFAGAGDEAGGDTCCDTRSDTGAGGGDTANDEAMTGTSGGTCGASVHGAGERAALELMARSPLPCIATCRPVHEGGECECDEASRLAMLQRLATCDSPPRYVDVELEAFEQAPNEMFDGALKAPAGDSGAASHQDRASLFVSSHDFKGRPADLLRQVARLRQVKGASVLKIAFTARSLRDNLELFDLLAERERPMIALAMGRFGMLSRVLAPKFGGFVTFASLRPGSVTAPGQPTLRELLDLYRFRSINAKTRVYGVIGWPVEQSLSPLIHNAGFDEAPSEESHDDSQGESHDESQVGAKSGAHNGVLLPMPIPPEWEHFKATLSALVDHAGLDFAGAAVTAPHKQHLIRFANERSGDGWSVDDMAMRAGAANTLARRSDCSWLVTNTDAPAIVECVRAAIGEDLSGVRVLALGAGGVTRAAAAGLADAGAHVTLSSRRDEQAQSILRELDDDRIDAAPWSERNALRCDVVINCTTLGMTGGADPDGSPIDPEAMKTRAGGDLVVFDCVYNPVKTPILREAKAHGLTTIEGVEMFVRQAASQFELWTGRRAPIALFDQLVRERLGRVT